MPMPRQPPDAALIFACASVSMRSAGERDFGEAGQPLVRERHFSVGGLKSSLLS